MIEGVDLDDIERSAVGTLRRLRVGVNDSVFDKNEGDIFSYSDQSEDKNDEGMVGINEICTAGVSVGVSSQFSIVVSSFPNSPPLWTTVPLNVN